VFDFFRAASPEKVWKELRKAAARGDAQAFLDLCRKHRELIKRELPQWRVIEIKEGTDGSEVQLHGMVLGTIAKFFADYLGDTGPRELLMSQPGDDEEEGEEDDDPTERWQHMMEEASSILENGDGQRAERMLASVLREMDAADGPAVDHLRSMVLGRIGECRLAADDHRGALEATTAAYEHCRRFGDAEGERIYAENIILIRGAAGEDPGAVDPAVAAKGQRVSVLALLTRLRGATEREEPVSVDNVVACLKMGDPAAIREWAPQLSAELNNTGIAFRERGDLHGARTLFEHAVRIHRETAAPDAGLARMLGNVAYALITLRTDLPRAGELLREALQIQQQVLPPDHREIAGTLHNLGALHNISGDATQAREHYRRSVAAKESREDATDSDLRNTIEHLSGLELAEHNDPEAKRALERLMRIENPDDQPFDRIGTPLNQLIDVYHRMGNIEAMKPLVAQFRARAEKEGKRSRWYAMALMHQASVHEFEKRRDAAEALFKEALAILRTAAEEPLELSAALNNAGLFFLNCGDDRRAIEHLEEALALKKERDIQWTANANNLSNAYARTGRGQDAIDLQTEALSIRKRVLPEGHPFRAQSAFNLAMALIDAGRVDDAVVMLSESLREENLAIDAAFGATSEEERAAFLREILERVATAGMMLLPHIDEHPAIAMVMFDMAVQRKAILAETIASERELLALNTRSELRPKFDELLAVRAKIARLTLDAADGAADQIGELKSQRRKLELDLARVVPEIALAERLRRADRASLAAALPLGAALLEFLTLDMFAAGTDRRVRAYFGFILPNGAPERVTMCVLGSAENIDPLIEQIRKDLEAESALPHLAIPIRAQWTRLSANLWQHLWNSFAPALAGRDRLFIVPDGALHRLPFGILQTETGDSIGDLFEISYLPTARDLLRVQHASGAPASAPLVIADPDYDAGANREITSPVFLPLAGTRAEGEAVATLLNVRPLLGAEATERAVKSRRSPLILHLATHGFFVEDQSAAAESLLRNARSTPRPLGGKDALLRSGVVLAGANTWLEGMSAVDDLDDGVLFAEDVLSMDLTSTELVVLSACETGLGEYQIGEGVFGLRRVFLLAGARTLIVSLWPVPDDATRELMEHFYVHLKRGARRVEALRLAQRTVAKDYEAPYLWAGFICIGDPNELPPNAFVTSS
jgi:CHAT domain-containing protein/tetratricopeptide (TPR) repeat protein